MAQRLLTAGDRVDRRYQILGLLGQGGMGVVYRARDLTVGREVALKVLHGIPGPKQLERFWREGAVTASLTHPGIVTVHATGEISGHPYIAYELVEGAQHLDEAFRVLDLKTRVALVLEAARALGVAHSHGVVHRDVKPENLLVDAAQRVRVADFGLARVEDGRALTRTGAAMGTPLYMAPEQFGGEDVGPAADVWGLGVVLFQALTLKLPFEGDALPGLRAAMTRGTAPSPRSCDPAVPRALDAVCRKALAAEPGARYPDANALADDLERAARGEAVEARVGGPVSQGLKRTATKLWWLGPLVPALGLLIWAATATRPPAGAATPSVAPRRPTSSGEVEVPRGPGWDLRHGDRFYATLGWRDHWTHDDEALGVNTTRQLMSLRGTAREIQGRIAILDMRLDRLLLEADKTVFSTEESNMLIPLSAIKGESFTVHLELPAGRVVGVYGVEALRQRVTEAAASTLRDTVEKSLTYLTDIVIKRHLEVVLHALPGDEVPDAPWERELVLWVTKETGVRVTSEVTPQPDDRYAYRGVGAEVLAGPRAGGVESPELAASLILSDGLVSRADVTLSGHVTRPGGRVVYQLDYELSFTASREKPASWSSSLGQD